MNRRSISLVTLIAASCTASLVHAAEPNEARPPEGRASEVRAERRFGVETSVLFPVVHIYLVRGSYAVWRHGEVLAGFALQRWSDEDFGDTFPPGQAEAYTLLLGYRQYLWRGLHVEVALFPAYNRFHSSVDNEVYPGLELWAELYAGYKIRFDVAGVGLFVTPQVGFGFGVAKQTRWPGESKNPDRGWSFVPNVLVGVEL